MSSTSSNWSQAVHLSPLVESTISEIFPSSDPLDSPGFDPITYLNAHFPTEASLGKLDDFVKQTNDRVKKLDGEIRHALRHAAAEEEIMMKGMEHATRAIGELCEKIVTVRKKADESEQIVQGLCAEVKNLDYAKRNLTGTFTALKRLHMLSSAVDQLQEMAERRQYQAANLLEAIDDLFLHFEDFKEIKKIWELKDRVVHYKRLLQESIMHDFRLLGASPEGVHADMIKNLKNACEIIGTIGSDAVKMLVDWEAKKQLEAYIAIFEPIDGTNYREGNPSAGLGNIEQRYTWLKKRLQKFVQVFGNIFPRQWNVPGRICIEFCLMTHQHLIKVLNDTKDQGAMDVQVLVRMLQRTINFEEELERYYSKATAGPNPFIDDLDSDVDPNSAEGIRRKYKEAKEANNQVEPELSDRQKALLRDQQNLFFKGIISKAFAAFMSQYVVLERTNISQLIEKIKNEEVWVFFESKNSTDKKEDPRLPSSDNLFMYFRKSLQQCQKLDTKDLLYEIICEYKKGLLQYCDLLRSKLPKSENVNALGSSDLRLMSRIVNTSEYCIETIPSMKENIEQVLDPSYSEKLDFETEIEAFQLLINHAIDPVVNFILSQLETPLGNMEKMNWGTWESVGDSSAYVGDIKSTFQKYLSAIAESISAENHSYLCRKLVETFIPRYLTSICRCKRISELGSHQLLLDAQELESLLQRLPKIGLDPKTTRKVPALYTKFIKKEMGKTVAILKTIACPPSATGETFRTIMQNGNFSDLAKLMDLKGMKKSEQQSIIDLYNRKVPIKEQMAPFLRDESSLSVDASKFAQSIFSAIRK